MDKENYLWNLETCIKGATERLPSILMTALVAGLALLPIALGSNQPGKEIEAPMAAIIIGGLVYLNNIKFINSSNDFIKFWKL